MVSIYPQVLVEQRGTWKRWTVLKLTQLVSDSGVFCLFSLVSYSKRKLYIQPAGGALSLRLSWEKYYTVYVLCIATRIRQPIRLKLIQHKIDTIWKKYREILLELLYICIVTTFVFSYERILLKVGIFCHL